MVFSLALAPVDTLATDLAVGLRRRSGPGRRRRWAETSAEFGGALGIAVLGVVGTSIYRSQLTGALLTGIPPKPPRPRGTPSAARSAAAGQLPDQLGQTLLRAAHEAFTQGLHVAFSISAAAVIGAATLTAILLRHLGPSSEPDARLDPASIP